MTARPFQVGIVGYGSSAKTLHIPFIQASPWFTLHSVVQRQAPTSAIDAGDSLANITIYMSFDDMVKDDQVQLVVIATPPESHFELASLALNANKHVVVEKPFTPSSSEAEKLISLARERNLLLTVYHNRRWDSDFLTLQSHVTQGLLGRIVEFESHFDRHRPNLLENTWKAHPSPGNAGIYDLGTHLIDQAVQLFGMPARVTGIIQSQRTTEVNTTKLQDSFTILLHYADGLLATLKAGVVSPERQQLRFWVRGAGGSFRKLGFDIQESQLKSGMQPTERGFGIDEEGDTDMCFVTRVQAAGGVLSLAEHAVRCSSIVAQGKATYGEFYRRLATALVCDEVEQLPVSAEQAAQVIRLVEIAIESSNLGKTLLVQE